MGRGGGGASWGIYVIRLMHEALSTKREAKMTGYF